MEIIALTVVYLAVDGHGLETALAVFAVLFAIPLLAGALVCLWVALDLGGNDDPGSDGDGPGRGRRPPPPAPLPPESPVSWPDFERQFAEHVEALGDRDPVATR
jgi:hypothetical protein